MGLAHSPNIISDGLVLYVDAANTRSYGGSGTSTNGLVGGIGGTLVNGVGYTSSNNGSFIFDGSNDFMSVGSLGTFYTQGTISFWMKSSDVSVSIRNPFSTNYNGSINFNVLRFETGAESPGTIRCWFGDPSNNYTGLYYSNISADTWYNVVVTWNQSTTTVTGYLNGTFDVTNSSWTRWPTSFVNVAVGLGYNSRFYQGNIGQVQIYNRTLSEQEILQNYNATRKRFGL